MLHSRKCRNFLRKSYIQLQNRSTASSLLEKRNGRANNPACAQNIVTVDLGRIAKSVSMNRTKLKKQILQSRSCTKMHTRMAEILSSKGLQYMPSLYFWVVLFSKSPFLYHAHKPIHSSFLLSANLCFLQRRVTWSCRSADDIRISSSFSKWCDLAGERTSLQL